MTLHGYTTLIALKLEALNEVLLYKHLSLSVRENKEHVHIHNSSLVHKYTKRHDCYSKHCDIIQQRFPKRKEGRLQIADNLFTIIISQYK